MTLRKLGHFERKIDELKLISEPNTLLETVSDLLSFDPNNSELLALKLRALAALNQATSDLGFLRKYCWYRSLDPMGFYWLALAYLENDDIGNALISLAYCLSVDPDFSDARRNVDEVLNKLGKKQLAVSVITADRVGHLIVETDSWLRHKKQQNEHARVYNLFIASSNIANEYLYTLIQAQLNIVENDFWVKLFNSRPTLLSDQFFEAMPYDLKAMKRKKVTQLWPEADYCFLKKIQSTQPSPFTVPPQDIEIAFSRLKKFGFSAMKKIVTFHVRDSAFLAETLDKDCSYHDYRDAKISTYKDAVLHLLGLGYQVIRVGRRTNQLLGLEHPSYFDLSQMPIDGVRDLVEVAMISQSQFCIANTSGPQSIAAAFDIPILGINIVPFGFFFPCYSWFIPKKYKQNGQLLSFVDVLNGIELIDDKDKRLDILACMNGDVLKANYIDVVDNTSEEIFLAVQEFEQVVSQVNRKERDWAFPKPDFLSAVRERDFKNMAFDISPSFIRENAELFI